MSSEAQKKKPREIRELKEKLNGVDIDLKQEAIRGIISYMTNGKDVSSLFMDVLKNITTPSLQLKKLIYLYVMSYAKAHPDLAILGVNTFRKVPLHPLRMPSTNPIPSSEPSQSGPWDVSASKISPSISAIRSNEHSKTRTPTCVKLGHFACLNCIRLPLNLSTVKDSCNSSKTYSTTVMRLWCRIPWFHFQFVPN